MLLDEVESKMSHSESEKLFEEREKVAKLSQIREVVFGTEDGLLVPLGVVSGVAGQPSRWDDGAFGSTGAAPWPHSSL